MDETHVEGGEPAAQNGGENVAKPNKPGFWKRRPVIIAGTVVLAVLFFPGVRYLADSFAHESTDDAFLEANIVSIAPKISGRVKHVFVNDNQLVKAGDPLVEIDPGDFDLAVAQKKAALASAEANVSFVKASFQLLATEVETAKATARESEADAASDQAAAVKAEADLKRAEDLFQRKIISPQEYDAAKAAADSFSAKLNAGQAKAASDESKVASAQAQLEAGRRAMEHAQAQSDESGVEVQQAELDLSYTRVSAPQDGRIARKAVAEGDYIQVGQRLMALVPTEVWVTANFKETQLKNIRTNQPVKIEVDSVGGKIFTGHVDSIQPGSGARFSLLPPENSVGNFVKVVQRVPVKIVFDAPPQTGHVLGPGMSVSPSIRVRGFELTDLEMALIAAVLALAVGFLWWRTANGKKTNS